MNNQQGTVPNGLVQYLGCSYLPSIQKAVHAIQDADTYLLGLPCSEKVSKAMGSHREALAAISRFVAINKGI